MNCGPNIKTSLAGKNRSGWTLPELMISVAMGALIMASVLSVFVFARRSLDATMNYEELDRQSRVALDSMSRSIRETGGMTNYTATGLWFTNLDGTMLNYTWDTSTSQLTCNSNNVATNILLKGCSSLKFSVFQRTPSNGTTMLFWPATNASQVKVIVLDWICKRTNIMSLTASESVQTAKIVLRN